MEQQPLFLAVRVGDLVAVMAGSDWWMGHVIHSEGGARSSDPSLFQIACIDSGAIRTVNADAVVAIVQRSGTLQTAHNHSHKHQGSGQGNQQGNRHGSTRQVG